MVCKQSYIPSLGQIGQSFSVFTKGKRERNKMLHKHLHLIDSLTRVKDHWKKNCQLELNPPPKKKNPIQYINSLPFHLSQLGFLVQNSLRTFCVFACLYVCVCVGIIQKRAGGKKSKHYVLLEIKISFCTIITVKKTPAYTYLHFY